MSSRNPGDGSVDATGTRYHLKPHPALLDLQWKPEMEFHNAIVTRYWPNPEIDRIIASQHPVDRTSYHPGQTLWSEEWLELQDVLRPGGPNADFHRVERSHTRQHENIPYLNNPDGSPARARVFGKEVPIRDLPILPRTIATNVEEWRIEAWRRLDPRVLWEDILVRMGVEQTLTDKNTINVRCGRWRARHAPQLESWHGTCARIAGKPRPKGKKSKAKPKPKASDKAGSYATWSSVPGTSYPYPSTRPSAGPATKRIKTRQAEPEDPLWPTGQLTEEQYLQNPEGVLVMQSLTSNGQKAEQAREAEQEAVDPVSAAAPEDELEENVDPRFAELSYSYDQITRAEYLANPKDCIITDALGPSGCMAFYYRHRFAQAEPPTAEHGTVLSESLLSQTFYPSLIGDPEAEFQGPDYFGTGPDEPSAPTLNDYLSPDLLDFYPEPGQITTSGFNTLPDGTVVTSPVSEERLNQALAEQLHAESGQLPSACQDTGPRVDEDGYIVFAGGVSIDGADDDAEGEPVNEEVEQIIGVDGQVYYDGTAAGEAAAEY